MLSDVTSRVTRNLRSPDASTKRVRLCIWLPDQALNLVTGVSYRSASRQSVRLCSGVDDMDASDALDVATDVAAPVIPTASCRMEAIDDRKPSTGGRGHRPTGADQSLSPKASRPAGAARPWSLPMIDGAYAIPAPAAPR